MHKLLEILESELGIPTAHLQGKREKAEQIFLAWREERAEWLMDNFIEDRVDEVVRKAFELTSEKEECEHLYRKYEQFCRICKKEIPNWKENLKPTLPLKELPSKFEIYGREKFTGDNAWKITFQEKINDLIDYLRQQRKGVKI